MLMRPDVIPDDQPLPLWQSPQFADALRSIGTDAEMCSLGHAGQVMVVRRAFGPFGSLRFASRGPIWADGCEQGARVQALRDARLHIVNAEDSAPEVLRQAGYWRIMKPASVAILDVHSDFDRQLSMCTRKWRSAFRKGARGGFVTKHRQFSTTRDAWIFDKDRAQQRAKGYRALPARIANAIAARDATQVRISIAYDGPDPMAAMLFLQHGTSATYHIGWASDAGRQSNAHRVLLMEATAALAKRGVIQIELGLIYRARNPGLAQFKLGSGARLKQLGGTWIRHPFRRKR